MKNINSNDGIGKATERIVLNHFKGQGIQAIVVPRKEGYDVKAGDKLIEVKGTKQSIGNKNYFHLTRKEFLCACHNKNYWIYWVDVSKKEIVKNIHTAIGFLGQIRCHDGWDIN